MSQERGRKSILSELVKWVFSFLRGKKLSQEVSDEEGAMQFLATANAMVRRNVTAKEIFGDHAWYESLSPEDKKVVDERINTENQRLH
ncbi:hypothetical protein K2X83_03120 [Patescibacteria group bacterium]|nr:hypothetical protein [Patescibacteria group bacterium]